MKILKKILFIFLLILTIGTCSAQDPQLSQFFASPLYLAPSFAGTTKGSRVAMSYRNQWSSIPNAYSTYIFSLDHNFFWKKCGVGLIVLKDQAGDGHLTATNVGLQYSYSVPMNRTWEFRPGLSCMYSNRGLDFNKLVFKDQLVSGSPVSNIEAPTYEKRHYIDFETSVLTISKQAWLGVTVSHLSTPNQSLVPGMESRIPIKYSLFGGKEFKLTDDYKRRKNAVAIENITTAFLYRHQQNFDQLDIGLYLQRHPVSFGIWYRGLPFFKSYQPGYGNNDAIIFLLKFKTKEFYIGYSYDCTISKLTNSASGGSHEISMAYLFNQNPKKKKDRPKVIPCPYDFNGL